MKKKTMSNNKIRLLILFIIMGLAMMSCKKDPLPVAKFRLEGTKHKIYTECFNVPDPYGKNYVYIINECTDYSYWWVTSDVRLVSLEKTDEYLVFVANGSGGYITVHAKNEEGYEDSYTKAICFKRYYED